jgi:flagellar biogenesis protein FliO
MMDLYLHMGVALILVSGLILLLGTVVKKRQDKGSLMKIMGYQSLGPKKGLAMVRVGQEMLLVGVTATDVKLLKSLDPDASLATDTHREPAGAQSAAEPALVDPGPEAPRFDEELAQAQYARPARTAKVLVADAATNLNKLKALKDYLVCSSLTR